MTTAVNATCLSLQKLTQELQQQLQQQQAGTKVAVDEFQDTQKQLDNFRQSADHEYFMLKQQYENIIHGISRDMARIQNEFRTDIAKLREQWAQLMPANQGLVKAAQPQLNPAAPSVVEEEEESSSQNFNHTSYRHERDGEY